MKKLIIILTLFLFFININICSAASVVKKEMQIQAKDGFLLSATLEYPKVKGKKEYSTVVLLHSLGYNSEWWETLPEDLMNKGYAVLMLDMRGHGKSVYNAKLVRISWNRLTNKAYAKYPDDVIAAINYVTSENPKIKFFNNWAIVGADIGGAAGVIAGAQINPPPKTVVLLSPSVNPRGLYMPVKLAELGNVDIFCISGTNDTIAKSAQNYLNKFAQAEFVTYTSESKSTGMLMLKHEKGLSKLITEWVYTYLK